MKAEMPQPLGKGCKFGENGAGGVEGGWMKGSIRRRISSSGKYRARSSFE